MSRRPAPKFLSLFSGCGGLDLGFTKAGSQAIAALDADPLVVGAYRRNLGTEAIQLDLSVPFPIPDAWRNTDVVLAGPPCQGFSTAGKRRLNDPRNSLLMTAARIAIEIQPSVVIVENVAGAIAGRHKEYWNSMLSILRNGGYRAAELQCNASTFGVPQNRKRAIAIAWNTTFEGKIELQESPCPTLRATLSGIETAVNHSPKFLAPMSRAGMIACRIGCGQKLCNVRISPKAVHTWQIPKVFGRTSKEEREVLVGLLRRRRQRRLRDHGDADPVTAQALRWYLKRPVASTLHKLTEKGYVRKVGSRYDFCHTFNGKFRRLEWDALAPTVDTKYGDPYYFLHPSEARAFTVREAARIQGFSDDFTFAGPVRTQFQMIGNAVPPPMANAIAEFVLANILSY
ncbi:MAG: DNA cytosine methyltransferase [Candidatus Paceibacterota bacterium]